MLYYIIKFLNGLIFSFDTIFYIHINKLFDGFLNEKRNLQKSIKRPEESPTKEKRTVSNSSLKAERKPVIIFRKNHLKKMKK